MSAVPKEWLLAKVSVPVAESANMEDGRAFGHQHLKWERLKNKMAEGDELWEFSSPPASWMHLMGREGYAVVRNGEIIEALTVTME